MKYLVIIGLCLGMLVSCAKTPEAEQTVKKTQCPQLFGVWISYSELGDMANSKAGFQKSFQTAVKRCAALGVNALFVHVRANADAFYPSKLFPYSNQLETEPGYDMLAFMIDTVHKAKMQFHAWVNPYRVSNTSSDYKTLRHTSPAYRWLTDKTDENDSYVVAGDGVLYLNPSVPAVKKLILNGLDEILQTYEVDGIHFDDYFYLSTDEKQDELQYVDYLSKADSYPLPLDDWRRAHVSDLISAACRRCRAHGVLFGVSPAANTGYNYDTMYADVEQWLRHNTVDYIMPQIYFGYEYPDARYTFESYLKEWKAMAKPYQPTLYVGLAPYKGGSKTETEWSKHSDIVSRQMEQLDNDKSTGGYCLFSYSYLFSGKKCYVNQLKCIKKYRSACR